MKNTFKFNIPLLLALFFCVSQQSPLPDQVIEIFRHGARGPITGYDPQWSSSELGKLTKTGMVEQYNLGKALAEKYPNLVASGYNPDDVYVLANFVERCIESAMVQVSSMFRGTTSTVTESLPKGLQASLIAEYESLLPASEASRGDYVPINVKVVSTEDEKLFFNGKDAGYCHKMSEYVNENQNSQKMKEAWGIFQDPVNQANTQLPANKKLTSMTNLVYAFDAFIADVFDNRPLPGGITDTKLIESLNYGFAYDIYLREQSQLIQRQLGSYNTLESILGQMANFRAGKNAKKLALYGGHDKNLYSILAAFGIVTGDCLLADFASHTNNEALPYPNCQYPGFASHIVFEFYNDTSSPYVKFYYNDVLIPLCDGQDSCSYSDFRVLAQSAGGNNTPDSWNKQCENKKIQTWKIIAGSVSGGVFVLLAALLIRWVYLKRKASAQKLKVAACPANIIVGKPLDPIIGSVSDVTSIPHQVHIENEVTNVEMIV